MEANGVETQNEHFIPSPNRWANQEGELGDPTILKELCGGESIRLGGPFGVSRVLLQQLGTLATGSTPFQMVTGKSPIVPMTWAAQG